MRRPVSATSDQGGRYRRSPALVLYWTKSGAACFDCITSQRTRIDSDIVGFLDRVPAWTTAQELVSDDPTLGTVQDVERLLVGLARRGLVEQAPGLKDGWSWHEWSPEAAFFHFGTRGGRYAGGSSPLAYDVVLRAKARTHPPPPVTKVVPGPRIALPAPSATGSLADALLERRTWRRFGRHPVPLTDLATLLQLTWGVQKTATVPGQGRILLKTSPSGGSRHSIEAYVVVLNVGDVPRGVYHYDCREHGLVAIDHGISTRALTHALANQRYFVGSSAIIVMTAIFARAMWRYPYSRAYRSILTEAGHLGQTFCLLSTALGLAPFCTMAFRDHELETLLRVDGIAESAIYVVGVGSRPRGRIANPGRIPR